MKRMAKIPSRFSEALQYGRAAVLCAALMLFANVALGQDGGVIAGTVTDSTTGQPLPGVNVVIQGTQQGASTGAEGTYEIPGLDPGTYTLQASFVGFTPKTIEGIEVGADEVATADFELVPSTVALDEVVAVAYGEVEQANVTGSVSKIEAENFEEAPVAGFENAMAGKAAGVQVQQSSGVPGGGTEINIRGLGSISATNAPLYVVDGVPVGNSSANINNPLNSIAPQDIESISILKDAASAALYGSRANNGVVIITTKRGSDGEPRITFSSQVGVQAVPSYEEPDVMNAAEYVRFRQESIIDDHIVSNGLDVDAENFRQEFPDVFNEIVPEPLRDPDSYGEGTNWFDAITDTAPFQQHNLSVRGGNEAIQYYVSGNFTDQEGVLRSTGFQRYSARANLDATITDALRFGVSLSPTRFIQQRGPTDPSDGGFSVFSAVMLSRWTLPVSPLRNEDGDLRQSTQVEGLIPGPLTPFFQSSPAFILENIEDEQVNSQVLLNTNLEYEPITGLVLKTSLGVNYRDVSRQRFDPSTVAIGLTAQTPTNPFASIESAKFFNVLTENTVNYTTTLADRHSIELLGGVSAEQDRVETFFFGGTDFPSDEVQTLNAAPTINGGQSVGEYTLLSSFGRLNYNYDERYLLTAALRADGSSRFGENNRWGYFPSVSAGWRIDNEAFMDGVETISTLKLKAGYGEIGNNSIGNYAALAPIGTDNYVFGNGFANGRAPTGIPNTELGWEETKQIDVGLEVGILDDRAVLTTDLFRSSTTDLLFGVPVAAISGFNSSLSNVGEIQNRGLEFSLETRNFTGDFSWDTEANVSFIRNKVVELGPEGRELFRGFYGNGTAYTITQEGEPIGQFYGLEILGLWSQEEIDAWVAEHGNPPYPGVVEGALKYRDGNGNGRLEVFDDYVVLGTPWPDFTYGMTNTLRYKGADLRVTLNGSVGGQIFDMTRIVNQNIDGVFNVGSNVKDRFRPGDDPNEKSVPTTVGQYNRQQWRAPNSAALSSATYLWVRNVTLGYDVGSNLLSGLNAGVQSARIYGSIQNALLLSGFQGNPESRKVLDSPLVQNVYAGSYPVARTFTLGLNLTF